MPNGLVRIVLRAEGAAQVRRALRGTAQEARQADQTTERSAQQTGRARARAAAQSGRDATRAARSRASAEIEADRAILESARRTTREEQRLLRQREREARASARRQAEARRQLPGTVAAAVAGIGGAALSRVQGWQAAFGVQSRETLMQRWIDRDQRLIRLQHHAGITADRRREIGADVERVSLGTNVDQSSILSGLEVAQNRFSNLEYFAQNIERIAQASQAAGGSVEDWVGAVGEFQRQLGITADEADELISQMTHAADAGSIEAGDVAANFSGLMSRFVMMRGDAGRGMGGAREFLGLAEALGAGGLGAEGTRTLMENLLSQFGRHNVQQGIERQLRDRNIFDRQGRLTIGFDELIGRMSERELNSPDAFRRMGIRDTQAQTALAALLNQFQPGGANPITALMQDGSAAGRATIDETMRDLTTSESGLAAHMAIQQEADFDGEQVSRATRGAAQALTDFEAQFPLVNDALGMFRDSLTGAVQVLGALRLAALGGGALGIGGGAAGVGGLGAAIGGTGAAGGLAAGGGLALGAAAIPVAGVVGAGVYSAYQDEQHQLAREQAMRMMQDPNLSAEHRQLAVDELQRLDLGEASLSREQVARRTSAGGSGASAQSAAMQAFGDRMTVGLDEDSIRRMGSATADALRRGAPERGRTSGEPGRGG